MTVEFVKLKQDGTANGKETLALNLDSKEARDHHIYLVAKFQEARLRQGSANSKNRSQVRGGGAKPYRQKGTGRARRGTNRTPLKVGGGVIFGPTPRDFSHSLNKKLVKDTIKYVMSQKEGKVYVLDSEMKDSLKTKDMQAMLTHVQDHEKERSLFIMSDFDSGLFKACRNLSNSVISVPHQIYVLDLLNSDRVFVSQEGFNALKEAWS